MNADRLLNRRLIVSGMLVYFGKDSGYFQFNFLLTEYCFLLLVRQYQSGFSQDIDDKF